MMQDLRDVGEKQLLLRLQKYLGVSGKIVRVFSEDCAVLDSNSEEYQLYTVDSLVEGVHFSLEYVPAFFLGKKAIKINVSDISAMGGRPLYYMVSMGAPSHTPLSTVDQIYEGMSEAAKESRIQLIGGNVSSSDVLFLDIFLIGSVKKKDVLFRKGARKGDAIFVTGRLGASAEGLKLLKDGFRLLGDGIKLPENQRDSKYVREAILAHFDPPDLNPLSQSLAKLGFLNCMIDLSDGVASDIAEICRESSTGARIQLNQIPIAPSVLYWERKRKLDPFQLALSGGEDYHLLFTVSRADRKKLLDRVRKMNIEIFEIGEICDPSDGILGTDATGHSVSLGTGYQHFSAGK